MNRGGGGTSGYSNSNPRGKGRQSWRNVLDHQTPDGADRSFNKPMSGSSDRKSHKSWQPAFRGHGGTVSNHPENATPTGRQGCSNFSGQNYFDGGRGKQWSGSMNASKSSELSHNKAIRQSSVQLNSEKKGVKPLSESASESSSVNLDRSFMETLDHSAAQVPESADKHACDNENSECSTPVDLFDICPPKSSSVFTLKPSLLSKNREKRNDMKRSVDGPKGTTLRSGMVLLKNYLSSSEQVNILRICRTHGLGPAGFYQPRFRDGGKLHLKLMCFGEFWDPETSKYGELRPMDQAKPPSVPREFLQLVARAIKDSHSLIAEEYGGRNVEDILPPVKPDICIVNYYATTGRLGLHQDKDEGRESLGKGIPIVSFSIGDSAKFLYGDQRDAEKAEKITLESGDVLIFGGKSRHIFHGVSAILPDTAPKSLLEETNFRPGRLNLTFRQHL